MAKHIPRGELIQLLGKALLYLEVESHWRGDSLTNNCKTGFSLLEPHECALETQPDATTISTATPATSNTVSSTQRDTRVLSSLSLRADQSVSATSTFAKHQQVVMQGVSTTPSVTQSAPSNVPAKQPYSEANKKPTASAVASPTNLSELGTKRKVSPVPSAGPQEKRPRRDADQMDVVPPSPKSEAKPKAESMAGPSGSQGKYLPVVSKPQVRPRQPGPDDDITDPRAILLLPGHLTEVFVCSFNPVYYETLATGSKDAVVNLWKLPKPPTRVDAFVTSALAPNVLTLSSSNQADLTALHWSPDGNLLAVGSYDSVFRICTRQGRMYFTHPLHEKGPIFAVRFSKTGRWVLTASLDGSVAVWDVQERKLFKQYKVHRDCCLDVDWLTDDTFASAGADRRINIIKINETQVVKHLEGHEDEINQIRSNPSGTKVASCSDDMTARVYRVDNISSGEGDAIPGLSSSDNVVLLQGHRHSVSTVAWCPKTATGSHEIVATASFDNTARLWDSVTGQCLHVIEDHKRPVYAMAFSPNGQFIATGGGDGWLHIFSMKDYERKWSWFAGAEKPGVFEIDWQMQPDGVNRIALALEARQVAVIDVSKLAALNTAEYQSGLLAVQSTAGANLTKLAAPST